MAEMGPKCQKWGQTRLLTPRQDALAGEVTGALTRGEQNILETRTHISELILIVKALEHTHGRRTEAASRLGIGRNTLTSKIQELGIEE
jgi:two-component system nitrogen regulation response regulator GlnG